MSHLVSAKAPPPAVAPDIPTHPNVSTPTLPINANIIVSASPTTPQYTPSTVSPTTTFAILPHPQPLLSQDQHIPSPSQSKWRVTPSQKEALLSAFQNDAYPDLQRKVRLADQLGVTTAQISKWFQHRRESLTRLGQFKAQYNRTRRTPEQLDVLQAAFEIDRYPTADRLVQLEAQLTGVTAKQIKLWFKHRRKQVQKRNRTSSSPSNPSSYASSHHTPTGPPHSVVKVIHHPDLAAANHDSARPDWRPCVSAAALVSAVQHCQPVPAATGPVLQPASPTAVPYTFDPHSYYPYKTPHVMLAQHSHFSDMELMALRGAHAISNSKPSHEGLGRLAHMLNRPYGLLNDWFCSQHMGRPSETLTDIQQQPFTHSPIFTQSDNTAGRSYNSGRPYTDGQSPRTFQDFRKVDGDVQMAAVSEKSPNTPNATQKVANGRGEQDPATSFQQLDVKSTTEFPTAQRLSEEKNVVQPIANTLVQHMPPSMYSTGYMYQNGLDGGMVVAAHQTAAFAGHASSAPLLAPLRYMPATSNGNGQATYVAAPNPVWYQHAPNFSK